MTETPENETASQATLNTVLGAFTRKLSKNVRVRRHFSSEKIVLRPSGQSADSIDLIIGWGRKPKALKALAYAKKHHRPYVTLEDGFIHSMSQGRLGASSCSLVVDELGVFYDAKTASSLEQLINTIQLNTEQINRAQRNIETITRYNITKYNNAKLIIPDFIKTLRNTVLVIDQVRGDMSIPHSLASLESFNQMLDSAIAENPNSDILIKTHPDVINGKRKGCITLPKQLPPKVHIISENINPLGLLKHVKKVYVVSSQMGFEALLLGKPVVCFAAPFYTGWGLTDDRLITASDVFKRRKNRPDLLSIFYATYLQYSNYIHPDTEVACELEDVLEYIKLQYKVWAKHTGKIFCIGFSPWKKRFIAAFLKTPDNEIFFADNATDAKEQGFDNTSKVCLWSSRFENEANKLSLEFQAPIWRLEDGFIRSVSLGSNYALPASLVVDKRGLYFNPQKPSDLEVILSETEFSKDQLLSAKQLKHQLIEQAISKYNVGMRDVRNLFTAAGEKRKLLVPGQVADDASILKGCQDIKSNIDLLKIVRNKHPNDYIIYKPHPDVLSGNRKGHIDNDDLAIFCDEVVTDISITDCLQQVDEVHTMTSLVGFEALMRELDVYCYGIPFYSGWGLTTDRHQCERRTRKLSLNELLAGTLISYPLYMNWETKSYTTASHISNTIHADLEQLKKTGKSQSTSPPTSWRWVRKRLQLVKTMLYLMKR